MASYGSVGKKEPNEVSASLEKAPQQIGNRLNFPRTKQSATVAAAYAIPQNKGSQPQLANDLALIFEKRRKALQAAEDFEYFGGRPPTDSAESGDSLPRRWSAPSSKESSSETNTSTAATRPTALTVRFADHHCGEAHGDAAASSPSASAHSSVDSCGGECGAICWNPGCGAARKVTRCGRTYLKEAGRLIAVPPDSDEPPPPPPQAAAAAAAASAETPTHWEAFEQS